MNTRNTDQLREELGDFNSIICFRALVTGMEDALGEMAAAVSLKAAGRKRGKQLVESLGLTGAGDLSQAEAICASLDAAVGLNGTRLCAIDSIEQDGDTVIVRTRETICSAGEPQGSPRKCTFTLGAVHGAMEALLGQRYRGKQIGSVLRGDTHDVFQFSPV